MFFGCDIIASLKRGAGPFLFVAIDLFIDRLLRVGSVKESICTDLRSE